ncbi:MAG: LamG domain-containing protein, partial [Planctomycetes bacterium]|nr:LamG domain-containing protein [Planctomycetota bacterium]
GGTQYSKTLSQSIDTWYHIAVTKDSGTTGEIYINGVSLGTGTVGSTFTSSNIRIGAWSDTTLSLNGTIDDVLIYNRSLSADEIYQLYVTSLTKYDSENWTLYVNQSKNATDVLDYGTYTYFASSKDNAGTWKLLKKPEAGHATELVVGKLGQRPVMRSPDDQNSRSHDPLPSPAVAAETD